MRLTAGSCLVRLVRFNPPSIQLVAEKLSFKDLASSLVKGSPREQQNDSEIIKVQKIMLYGSKDFAVLLHLYYCCCRVHSSGTRSRYASTLPWNPRDLGDIRNKHGERETCVGGCRIVLSDGKNLQRQLGGVLGTDSTLGECATRTGEGRDAYGSGANSQWTLVQVEAVPQCIMVRRGWTLLTVIGRSEEGAMPYLQEIMDLKNRMNGSMGLRFWLRDTRE
ncbi:hypothetical protein Ahy_B02g061588 [Arachis hypogaea]|uniref:Uncharacterized protein n=1 Tax=Arachis hypogaea TaxID=3818 RepID=A0A445ALL0_ARAHY|nr:hypothetical protein Ahy_B02g061588 [Arachis hypogaea]